jgi:DNA-binding response OmpR family regulator
MRVSENIRSLPCGQVAILIRRLHDMNGPAANLRVAIIDRDGAFLTVLGKRLDAAGWQHRALSGPVPADELVAMKINALLVDPGALPAEDAWPFLERVCGLMPGLGVIVASNDSTVAQRVRGLRLGADDWISKPCHPEEVMARIEAVVRRRRRAGGEPERGPLVLGELEIRPDQFQAFVSGRSIDLTRREFELVRTLADSEGTVIERGEIYRRVWGYEMAHGDRSVDVFVRKLRSKIQKHSPGWTYIHTHFGIGYRFQAEPADGTAAAQPPAPKDEAPAGESRAGAISS